MTVVNLLPTIDLSNSASLVMDLANFKPKAFAALVEAVEANAKATLDVKPLGLSTGLVEITPTHALDLLRRNIPGANRRIDPATVHYYASQMLADDWPVTGQGLIFNEHGLLLDGQHRLYGVVISGKSLKTFVVTDVPAKPGIFAYMDNVKARTPATALQTAGFNGVSPTIAKVIKIAEEVRHGVYDRSGLDRLPRLSPAQVLGLAAQYPNAKDASRLVASDCAKAVDYIGNSRKGAVAYLTMRIIDLHGDDVAQDFLDDIVDASLPADKPTTAFRKEMDKDSRNQKQMEARHVLAALIKTFNAWVKQEALPKRWMPNPVNEDFPILEGPVASKEAEAAE